MANTGAIKAGAAFVELFSDSSKLDRGLKDASKKLKEWGSSIATVGGSVFAAGTAGLALPRRQRSPSLPLPWRRAR